MAGPDVGGDLLTVVAYGLSSRAWPSANSSQRRRSIATMADRNGKRNIIIDMMVANAAFIDGPAS